MHSKKTGAKPALRVIKKYPNRRLYDTDTFSYITLAEVKQLVMEGEPFVVRAGDDSGLLYGSLELAARIRDQGKIPATLFFADHPAFTLRGTCIGLQKTYILPGRKVYE